MESSAAGPTETGHPLTINNKGSQSWECMRWSAAWSPLHSVCFPWGLGGWSLLRLGGVETAGEWEEFDAETLHWGKARRTSRGSRRREQAEHFAAGCVGKPNWPTGASKHGLQRGPYWDQLLRWFDLLNNQLYFIEHNLHPGHAEMTQYNRTTLNFVLHPFLEAIFCNPPKELTRNVSTLLKQAFFSENISVNPICLSSCSNTADYLGVWAKQSGSCWKRVWAWTLAPCGV